MMSARGAVLHPASKSNQKAAVLFMGGPVSQDRVRETRAYNNSLSRGQEQLAMVSGIIPCHLVRKSVHQRFDYQCKLDVALDLIIGFQAAIDNFQQFFRPLAVSQAPQ